MNIVKGRLCSKEGCSSKLLKQPYRVRDRGSGQFHEYIKYICLSCNTVFEKTNDLDVGIPDPTFVTSERIPKWQSELPSRLKLPWNTGAP